FPSREVDTPAKQSATQRQVERIQTYRNTAEQTAKSVGEERVSAEKAKQSLGESSLEFRDPGEQSAKIETPEDIFDGEIVLYGRRCIR
ncbi:MAG: hypothetical protein ACI31D_07110, partial [Candidatus Limisoma sp.]